MRNLAILHLSITLQEVLLYIVQFILLDKTINENSSKSDESEKKTLFFDSFILTD